MPNPENLIPHRYPKGVSGNKAGRPVGPTLRQLLRDTATREKQEIIDALIALAKAGNTKAAGLVLRYSDDPATFGLELTTTEFTIKIGVPGEEEDDAVEGTEDDTETEPLALPMPLPTHDQAVVPVLAPDLEIEAGVAEADEEEEITTLAEEPAKEMTLPADPDAVYRQAQQAAGDAYIAACEGANRQTSLAADVIYQAALQKANNAHNKALLKAAKVAAQATKDAADPPSKQDKHLASHGWV